MGALEDPDGLSGRVKLMSVYSKSFALYGVVMQEAAKQREVD